jgi:hypothetical protein
MMLELAESQAWSAVVGGAGLVVRVRSGAVWLTREGDPEDHLLGAGQALETRRRGRLAVLALAPARLELAEPASSPLPARRYAPALSRR